MRQKKHSENQLPVVPVDRDHEYNQLLQDCCPQSALVAVLASKSLKKCVVAVASGLVHPTSLACFLYLVVCLDKTITTPHCPPRQVGWRSTQSQGRSGAQRQRLLDLRAKTKPHLFFKKPHPFPGPHRAATYSSFKVPKKQITINPTWHTPPAPKSSQNHSSP